MPIELQNWCHACFRFLKVLPVCACLCMFFPLAAHMEWLSLGQLGRLHIPAAWSCRQMFSASELLFGFAPAQTFFVCWSVSDQLTPLPPVADAKDCCGSASCSATWVMPEPHYSHFLQRPSHWLGPQAALIFTSCFVNNVVHSLHLSRLHFSFLALLDFLRNTHSFKEACLKAPFFIYCSRLLTNNLPSAFWLKQKLLWLHVKNPISPFTCNCCL